MTIGIGLHRENAIALESEARAGAGSVRGRETFSERGPDETFWSSSWAGLTNENPKMRMYIYSKAGRSMRRLVMRVMNKYLNIRLDG